MDMKHPKIIVAGIGPGNESDITPAVISALQESDVVVGYKYYFQFVIPYLHPSTTCIDTGMKRERARAEQAFELAEQGKTVCVISSGDAGIYGMTPLVYEMKRERTATWKSFRCRASALSKRQPHCWELPWDMTSASSPFQT